MLDSNLPLLLQPDHTIRWENQWLISVVGCFSKQVSYTLAGDDMAQIEGLRVGGEVDGDIYGLLALPAGEEEEMVVVGV